LTPIRVIVISAVRPELSSGGQLILYRHLCGSPGLQLEIHGAESPSLKPSIALRRFVARLRRTRFHRWEQSFQIWQDGRWLDGLLPKRIKPGDRTLVLTVAHGDVSSAARRFARRHHLPLVSIFHDWWPDLSKAHSSLHGVLENRFQQLYDQSTVALCVSEGMRAALGPHRHAEVLYPISGTYPASSSPDLTRKTAQTRDFRILYFGNLYHYATMVGSALEDLKNHPKIRLEVRGSEPNWPEPFRTEMKQRGLWLEFVPVGEFARWLASGDAFLVTMAFDPSLRRQMETSFPSKLVECVQFGKPLIIWGPEYCSAVRWARRENSALCVTNPDPAALRAALEVLGASPSQQKDLQSACRRAEPEFNPQKIHAQFIAALEAALQPGSRPPVPNEYRNRMP
jgi:glycosyltransferase involved in cell wall biosynthesis